MTTLYEAALLVQRMCREALPKFNWGASFLDANAIDLLNRAPAELDKALAAQSDGAEVCWHDVLQTLLDIWHGGHLQVRPEAVGHWNAAVEAGEALLGRLDQLASRPTAPKM